MINKLFLLLFLVMTGCTAHVANLTAVSTREVHAQHADLDKFQTTRHVTGTHTTFCPLFIPLFDPGRAVDDALSKGNGNLLINTDMYVSNYFAILGSVCSFKVTGDVVNLNKK